MKMTKTNQREWDRLETLNIPESEKEMIRWHILQNEKRRAEKLAANRRGRQARAMAKVLFPGMVA